MKTIINEETGELIETDDTNDIALRKLNEIVNIDELVDMREAMEIAKINYENKVKEINARILDVLREMPKGEQHIITKYLVFQRKDGYLRKTFDSKKFKDDYPELYSKYISSTVVNESLVIKERKD